MKCWICGSPAGTGEHMIKASDLRGQFGEFSQDTPLYQHSESRRNRRIGSIKSKKLKYAIPICAECNNSRTQPYDRAWQALSERLQASQKLEPPARRVNLKKVFPGTLNASMLGVHLYFVKAYGCRIAESGMPLDLKPFSDALLTGKPHPRVYLEFGTVDDVNNRHAGVTPIHAANVNNRSVFGNWLYSVGRIGVRVIYWKFDQNGAAVRDVWHPFHSIKSIKLRKLVA